MIFGRLFTEDEVYFEKEKITNRRQWFNTEMWNWWRLQVDEKANKLFSTLNTILNFQIFLWSFDKKHRRTILGLTQ